MEASMTRRQTITMKICPNSQKFVKSGQTDEGVSPTTTISYNGYKIIKSYGSCSVLLCQYYFSTGILYRLIIQQSMVFCYSENITSDILQGCAVVTLTLLAFMGLVSALILFFSIVIKAHR